MKSPSGSNKPSFPDASRGAAMRKAKSFGLILVVCAAVFGFFSAAILVVTPEKVPSYQDIFSAKGANKGYRLPEADHTPPLSSDEQKIVRLFQKAFVGIAKNSRPALAYIVTKRSVAAPRNAFPFPDDFFFPFMQPPGGGGGGGGGRQPRGVQQGAGSGFIVDLKNGYVITNHHVVEGAEEITVTTYDDRKFKGKVIGSEPSVDVAVIKLEKFTPGKLRQVAFGDSDALEVGEWVVCLGAPYELPQTLTAGVVSAIGRSSTDVGLASAVNYFIQTDAAINPGNSGGPMLNMDGRVVGINSAIYSRTGSYSGIGFAVPSNTAKTVAEKLIADGKITRGYMGIIMVDDFGSLSPDVLKSLNLSEDSEGALVREVKSGSPSDKAGLKAGDFIVSIDGTSIKNPSMLRNRVAFSEPNSNLKITYIRDGAKKETTLKVGEFPSEGGAGGRSSPRGGEERERGGDTGQVTGEFGLEVAPLTPELKKQLDIRAKAGALITNVAEFAQEAGLQRGDVILEIDRKPIKSPADVESALKSAREKNKALLFLVEREGRNQLIIFRNR